jgi:uncharacterized protein
MFRIELLSDIAENRDRLLAFLCRDEAKHCWPLGMLNTAPNAPVQNAFEQFWSVFAQQEIVGLAWLMKSTHFFGLTDMPNEAVPALVDAVFVNGKAPTGISGPTQQGNLFAKTCSERHGMQVSVTVNQRIYRLDAVSEISRCPGSIQVAREEDRELLEAWGLQFSQDCHIDTTIERNRESVTKAIAASSCFLWVVDNEPVAMTELRGPTPSGIRVSNVYTPPQWRGNGYATALVAAVSQRALAAGRKFCFLFTDLANPTSNRIYQRIGYRPVCEAVQHIFAKRSD